MKTNNLKILKLKECKRSQISTFFTVALLDSNLYIYYRTCCKLNERPEVAWYLP